MNNYNDDKRNYGSSGTSGDKSGATETRNFAQGHGGMGGSDRGDDSSNKNAGGQGGSDSNR